MLAMHWQNEATEITREIAESANPAGPYLLFAPLLSQLTSDLLVLLG